MANIVASVINMQATRFSWLPNAISVARCCCVPILAWLAFRRSDSAFAALLLPVLLSDVVDGWLARRLGAVSRLGALLDSVADILVILVIVYAIWPLHPEVYTSDGWVIIGVVLVWVVAHLFSLWRYGRLASFHTWLIRIGIFMFYVFALYLFLIGFEPWLLYLAAAVCALGAVEHFILLALLPTWTPDLHGGIPEALARRRERQ